MPDLPEEAAAFESPLRNPSSLPEEAVQAAIDGVDHEYVERRGFDRNAARAALVAAAPVIAEQIAARVEAEIDPLGLGSGPAETEAWRSGMRLAARIARQIGEARDSR